MSIRAAALVLLVVGLAATSVAQPAPATGTAIIRGRVVAADTAKPLRGARLTIAAPGLGGPPRTTTTTPDGRYEFKNLPAGSYTVTATKGGYIQLRYGQRRALEQPRPLEVLAGQTVERIDFALPRTGVIAGLVADEVGDPIAGVTVHPMRVELFQGRRQLVPTTQGDETDEAGQYRLSGLSPGTYMVRATTRETWTVTRSGRKDVMSFVPTYFPGTDDLALARRVTVGMAEQVRGVDFSLIPGRTVKISGTAFNSSGRPVQSVMLGLDVMGPGGGRVGGAGNAVVAPDGSFTFRDVLRGEYKLRAAGSEEAVSVPVVVGDSDIENVALVTSKGWSATGTVTTESGAPLNLPRQRVGVTASALNTLGGMRLQGEPVLRSILNEDWTFSITSIIGPARFRVTLPDGWAVKSIQDAARDLVDTPVELKSGETLSGVRVIVTDRVTSVTGQLLDDNAVPLVDGTIVVFASDAGKWSEASRFIRAVRPNQQGQYRVKGLPPGEYLAVALDYVEDGLWNDPEYLASLRPRAEKLTLKEGESRAISLKLVTP